MALSLFGKTKKAETAYTEPPHWWTGSKPEWIVYEALLKLGMKGQFIYQSPQLGGRLEKGGAVIDFYFPDIGLGINIQSFYYHYASTTQRMNEQMQRAQLEGYGITMIYIDEGDVLRNPIYFVSEALAGRDHSKFGG